MEEIIIETLLDGLKLLPFLFITFLILELIEHKLSDKNKKIIEKSGKFGPIIGSILGAFPQCGFSVSATNFYATRIITLGTLISIYLSTSDEMLPLLISEGVQINLIIKMEGHFEQAAADIKTYGKDLSNEELLTLYSLYKQATVGDCNTERPGMLDLKGKATWDAWNGVKGKSQVDAKKEYVQTVLKYLPDDVKAKYN